MQLFPFLKKLWEWPSLSLAENGFCLTLAYYIKICFCKPVFGPFNRLSHQKVANNKIQGFIDKIGGFPVKAPLGAQADLGTEPGYDVPSDLWVEYVKTRWLTLGEWGFLLNNGPKLAMVLP